MSADSSTGDVRLQMVPRQKKHLVDRSVFQLVRYKRKTHFVRVTVTKDVPVLLGTCDQMTDFLSPDVVLTQSMVQALALVCFSLETAVTHP